MSQVSRPALTLIAAMASNRVIGADGGMPWHIPGDLRWFKQQTLDKPILMGRRTFDSIGRALPGRRNLVLSRDPRALTAQGIEGVTSLEAALEQAQDAPELMIIGGAQLYALTLPIASRLIVTRIDRAYDGDTFFPEVDWSDWTLMEEQSVLGDEHTPPHRFMTWQRKAG